jgi:hypothetical protein
MVTRTAASTINPLESLSRRVTNPKPVSLATLHKRHQEACRLCQTIRTTLSLLDVSADGTVWGGVYRLVMRAEDVATLAYHRWDAAWQEEMRERHEAEQLADALMSERWLEYEMAGSGEVDTALAWIGE